jgi:hypothetical protein
MMMHFLVDSLNERGPGLFGLKAKKFLLSINHYSDNILICIIVFQYLRQK